MVPRCPLRTLAVQLHARRNELVRSADAIMDRLNDANEARSARETIERLQMRASAFYDAALMAEAAARQVRRG